MKLSVSLPDADVEFIDEFAAAGGYASRSAVVQKALDMLRAGDLVGAYEDAFASWERTGEDKVWAVAVGDGLDDAPR
ncbi:MAG: ribbon-helix-helix domain-containing protein [Candidatus Nanopelagicales bacterium]